MAAFNSPVWFNVGFEEHPQCSACFILSVEDELESILDWNTKEGKIFRGGSGSGINLSKHPRLEGAPLEGRPRLRAGHLHARRRRLGRHDQVGRQDPARGQDGRARRRPPGHPRLHLVQGARGGEGAALRDAGFDMRLDSEHFASIQYQNANNSVRVTDEFMERAERGEEWELTARNDGAGRSTASTPATCSTRSPTPRGAAPIRASSTTRRSTSGTPARTRAASTRRTRARSTCTSTTRPATSPRSTS